MRRADLHGASPTCPLAERVRPSWRGPRSRRRSSPRTTSRSRTPGSMANLFGLFQTAAAYVTRSTDPLDYEPTLDQLPRRPGRPRSGRDPLDVALRLPARAAAATRSACCSAPTTSTATSTSSGRCCSTPTPSPASPTPAPRHLHLRRWSMPTTQISFWVRDRQRGEQLPLESLVAKQTAGNARSTASPIAGRWRRAAGRRQRHRPRSALGVPAHCAPRPPRRRHPAHPARHRLPRHDGRRRGDPP